MGNRGPRGLALAFAVLTTVSGGGALAPPDLGAKILFPPDKALLSGDGAIEVLAFRPAAAGPGSLAVGPPGAAASHPAGQGVVRMKVTLRPGANTLRLDGETVNVFLRGPGADKAPAGFETSDEHAVGIGCEDCHRIEPEGAPLAEPAAKLCRRCHGDVTAAKGRTPSIHPPAAEGECAACHRTHGAAVKKLSGTGQRALCLGCHDDPGLAPGGTPWAAAHPALSDGCLRCHAPHASPGPHLLGAPEAALCAACHADKGRSPEGAAWATPHPPVAKGLCSACHGVHGAPFKRLLSRPGNKVCDGCHRKTNAHHRPLDKYARLPKGVAIPSGFPIDRNGVLGCGGCHLPHGSDTQRLWVRPEQEFCPRCHKSY